MKHCKRCTNSYHDMLNECPNCGCSDLDVGSDKECLPVGSLLSKRYTIEKLLSKSSSAISYLAKDSVFKKTVFIKEYYPDRLIKRETSGNRCELLDKSKESVFVKGMKEFVSMARLYAKFRDYHSSPAYYDVFKENGTVYYSREYIVGNNLTAFRKMPIEKKIELISPIIFFLNKLHNLGIYHGAIKPENIIIDDNSNAILTDFAIVDYYDNKCSFINKSFATAPEINTMGVLNSSSDIYSIASVFYYIYTDILPPTADERKFRDNLIPPIDLNAEITEDLSKAIVSGMILDATERDSNIITFARKMYPKGLTDSSPVNILNKDDEIQHTVQVEDRDLLAETQPIPAIKDEPKALYRQNKKPKQQKSKPMNRPQTVYTDDDKTVMVDKKSTKKMKLTEKGTLVLLVLVLILVIFGSLFILNKAGILKKSPKNSLENSNNLSDDQVYIPSLLSLDVESAEKLIKESGFIFNISGKENSDSVAENLIMYQTPDGGTLGQKGNIISVTVSAGKAKIEIENYVGQNGEEVKKQLESLELIVEIVEEESIFANGFIIKQSVEIGKTLGKGDKITLTVAVNNNTYDSDISYKIGAYIGTDINSINDVKFTNKYIIEIVYEYHDTVKEGYIFKQTPDAGTSLAEGSTITLYVSNGREQITVPDVQYKSLKEAKAMLESAGLKIKIEYEESDIVKEGHVIRQDVSAGTKADKNAVVTIYVSTNTNSVVETNDAENNDTENNDTENNANVNDESVYEGPVQTNPPLQTNPPVQTVPPTEATTEATTEAPTTAAPTEAPTEAPTTETETEASSELCVGCGDPVTDGHPSDPNCNRNVETFQGS